MTSLKILGAAAVMALAPLAVSPSYAQSSSAAQLGITSRGGGGSPSAGLGITSRGAVGGGGHVGGGWHGGGGHMGGGWHGGGGQHVAGGWHGGGHGGWHGGHGWHGHRYHGGFWPGVVAGAAIGSAFASPYYYNDYDPYYYDDDVTVGVAVPSGGDAVAYCERRFKSYDPASGTYLGYDGHRHPCP